MKHLEWFKIGDKIPSKSKFIKEKTFSVGHERKWVDDDPMVEGRYENIPILEEHFLYEVEDDQRAI